MIDASQPHFGEENCGKREQRKKEESLRAEGQTRGKKVLPKKMIHHRSRRRQECSSGKFGFPKKGGEKKAGELSALGLNL